MLVHLLTSIIWCTYQNYAFRRLLDCIPVTNDFHARFSCKSRTYLYRFMIPKVPKEERISLPEGTYTYHLR